MKKNKLLISLAGVLTAGAIAAPLTVMGTQMVLNNTKTDVDSEKNASSYVKFTFNANGGSLTGESVFRVKSGKSFATIVAPTPSYAGHTFLGWFKESTGQTQWAATDTIDATNNKAYAKWSEDVQTKSVTFSTAGAIKNGTTYSDVTATLAGPSTQAVPAGTAWTDVGRPQASAEAGKFLYWATRSGSAGSYTYTEMTGNITENVTVYPIFNTPEAHDIDIIGAEEIMVQRTTEFSATVTGEPGLSKNVDWKVQYKDLAGVFHDAKDVFVEETVTSGKLTIKGLYTVESLAYIQNDTIDLYVTATSKDTSTVTSTKTIKYKLPSYDSEDSFVVEVEPEGEFFKSATWYRITSDLTEEDANIEYVKVANDESAETPIEKARTEFGDSTQYLYSIYLGNKVHSIEDNFLKGCTKFNGYIGGLWNVVSIGDSFLENCTSYNQQLQFGEIVAIGTGFLSGCTSFNNGSTSEETYPLNLDNVRTIEDDFMNGCTAYGLNTAGPSSIQFGYNLKRVGTGFLSGLKKDQFANKIEIALYDGSDADSIFVASNDSFTTEEALTTETGIRVNLYEATPEQKASFKTKFPDLTGEKGLYRKLNIISE